MRYFFGRIFQFFLVIYVGFFFFFLVRPFPEVLRHEPISVNIDPSAITFLADVTYTASSGADRMEENIFPTMLDMVSKADRFVYANMFLFNEFQGKDPETYRDETKELADALVKKKTDDPKREVVFMTDPINRGYGGIVNTDLERMEAAGIRVYEAPLDALRDSNLIWSTIYRMFFIWFPNSESGGWLPNPLDEDGEKVTLRTYARLLNFKANHRKVLITDQPAGKGGEPLVTLIGSLNPHTASSPNGNVALKIESAPFANAVLYTESSLLDVGGFPPITSMGSTSTEKKDGTVTATYLTEESIEKAIEKAIDDLGLDDRLDIAVFYLSDADVIRSIERAAKRGVKVRLLLDPNDSAFGKKKYGIPNRQTVERLLEQKSENMSIRWCNTHGEQCHAKMLIAVGGSKTSLIIGSANYTRRNLDRFNLEGSVLVESSVPTKAIVSANQYMDRMWNNTKGETSVPVETYRDQESWKRVLAWIMERTGLSTF
jgi:hypothetical protein